MAQHIHYVTDDTFELMQQRMGARGLVEYTFFIAVLADVLPRAGDSRSISTKYGRTPAGRSRRNGTEDFSVYLFAVPARRAVALATPSP